MKFEVRGLLCPIGLKGIGRALHACCYRNSDYMARLDMSNHSPDHLKIFKRPLLWKRLVNFLLVNT